MPPKTAKTQRKAAASGGSGVCSICYQKFGPKDEVLLCSGSCHTHLHRYCASVSDQSYKAFISDDAPRPFLCFCCFRAQKDEEVAKLHDIIDLLKDELNALKKKCPYGDWPPLTPDADRPTKDNQPASAPGEPTVSLTSRTPYTVNTASNASHNPESKYNVVLYGVEECRPGLPRSARFESDLTSVVSVFSALDSSIQSQSVRDCYRLGKFSSGASRPRPLLVKFVRAADVSKIFARKKSLSNPFFVKPDLSQAERVRHSTLMQERWHLIQSGVSRKNIRVKGNALYVNNKLHGHASNYKFTYASASTGSVSHQGPSNSPSDASPIVQNDQQSAVLVHTSPDKSITSVVDKSCSPDNSCSLSTTNSASDNVASLPAPLTASDPGTNSSQS